MRINKAVAVVVGAVVLLALCAGTALLVTNSANNHNMAVQRAAATASHNRAVARASAAAQARAIAAANAKAARAEKAAKAANRATPAPAPPVVVPAAPAAQAGLTPCGTGTQGEEVYAGSDTSCQFALNVESDYAQGGYWNQSGTSQFYSYSPVTGQSYLMTSNSVGNPVVVTGGNGALVQFDY